MWTGWGTGSVIKGGDRPSHRLAQAVPDTVLLAVPFGLRPPQVLGTFLGPYFCFLPGFTQGPHLVGDGIVQGCVGSGVRVNVLILLCKPGQVSFLGVISYL